ncbi:MAG: hypothetical protein MZV65_19265 [Chromatiales bacterium]|nr:hypothetical protein [Chromatiales bacterium]
MAGGRRLLSYKQLLQRARAAVRMLKKTGTALFATTGERAGARASLDRGRIASLAVGSKSGTGRHAAGARRQGRAAARSRRAARPPAPARPRRCRRPTSCCTMLAGGGAAAAGRYRTQGTPAACRRQRGGQSQLEDALDRASRTDGQPDLAASSWPRPAIPRTGLGRAIDAAAARTRRRGQDRAFRGTGPKLLGRG